MLIKAQLVAKIAEMTADYRYCSSEEQKIDTSLRCQTLGVAIS